MTSTEFFGTSLTTPSSSRRVANRRGAIGAGFPFGPDGRIVID
jgi:hypothetical protein